MPALCSRISGTRNIRPNTYKTLNQQTACSTEKRVPVLESSDFHQLSKTHKDFLLHGHYALYCMPTCSLFCSSLLGVLHSNFKPPLETL